MVGPCRQNIHHHIPAHTKLFRREETCPRARGVAPSAFPPSPWRESRVRRLLLAAVLLLPALALADVDPRFAQLRDQAEPLGSLSAFLDKYVGECGSLFSGPGCRKEAEAFRTRYTGKKLYMIIGEGAASMVGPGPYQPGSGNYTIHVTPLFPAGPYALTQGSPRHTDTDGRPMLPFIQVTGTTPAGWSAGDFMRLFQKKQVRAQVVFTPQEVWSLLGKGDSSKRYGVAARIDGVLLTNARTGEPLGTWFADAPPKAAPAPAPKEEKKKK